MGETKRFYCEPAADEPGFWAEDWTGLAAGIVGAGYTSADAIGRDVSREDYCLAKLLLFPDAALDPRTEEAFCRSLAIAGIVGIWEMRPAAPTPEAPADRSVASVP